MNRIDPKTGGFPAYIPTDYIFLQNAFKEAIAGAMLLFGDSFIINGVEIDLSNGRRTAGWLVFKGEVVRVDEISGAEFTAFISIANKAWVVNEFVDPGIGNITYADGFSKPSHLIRRAIVIDAAGLDGQEHVLDASMQRYKIESNLALGFGSFGPNILPVGSFVGYVRESNRLRLHGVITVQASATIVGPGLLFTLPVGFRPQQDQDYIVGGILSNGDLFARIRVYGASAFNPGRVEVLNTLSGGDKITLDSIEFRLP